MTRRRLLAAALGALVAGAGAWSLAAEPKAIRITARKFSYTPNLVTLKKGVPVVLEFTSADVVMGFNAPELNIRADIIPGQVARVPFTPDRTGTFDFVCDIFCGDGHEKMTGQIRVT
jgi:cytochrome c oxidase subunit II